MKVEREKIIHYKFESKMVDIGTYKVILKFKRRTPRMDASYIASKSALTGGIPPITRSEMQMIDTIAALSTFVEPCDSLGKPSNDREWIDSILDENILFDIHKQWLDYQDSFYPKEDGGSKNDSQDSVATYPQ